MVTSLHRRRHIAWLALFAMLAMAMLPTLSHALALARGDIAWTEICTPQGMRVVAVSDESGAPAPDPISAAVHLEHCPYCAQSAGTLGMPPAPAGVMPLPVAGAELPALFLQAPHTLHAWRSAQPRAPPALS
jgi:hypothetical protein